MASKPQNSALLEGRLGYPAIRTVSDVAPRLCDEAKPGQILISPRVLVVVKDAVVDRDIGEINSGNSVVSLT
jgi:adenylate cyclase